MISCSMSFIYYCCLIIYFCLRVIKCVCTTFPVVWKALCKKEGEGGGGKPGKEWRWEQVVKQCEKHEGEKQQTPARETQPGSSITFQQSSSDWAAQTAARDDAFGLLPWIILHTVILLCKSHVHRSYRCISEGRHNNFMLFIMSSNQRYFYLTLKL